jgi:hypothetical protein
VTVTRATVRQLLPLPLLHEAAQLIDYHTARSGEDATEPEGPTDCGLQVDLQ